MDEVLGQRSGNLQRAWWRSRCREILADHLQTKLRSSIDPEDVRLKPDAQDGYRWNALPERQHLFNKQLSKHSIGAYMELCREVGKSFEAVALPTLDVDQGEPVQLDSHDARQATTDDSFLSIISQLKDENSRIKGENTRMKDELEHRAYEAQLTSDACSRWEQRSQNLEIDLQTAQDDLENVKHDKHRLLKKVRFLTKRIDMTQREVSKALVSLQQCTAPNALWKIDKDLGSQDSNL